MKTETQIAEIYIEDLKKYKKPEVRWHIVNRTCHEHKSSCERFLEFLVKFIFHDFYPQGNGMNRAKDIDFHNKITDLKQAIKLYNEAGI